MEYAIEERSDCGRIAVNVSKRYVRCSGFRCPIGGRFACSLNPQRFHARKSCASASMTRRKGPRATLLGVM